MYKMYRSERGVHLLQGMCTNTHCQTHTWRQLGPSNPMQRTCARILAPPDQPEKQIVASRANPLCHCGKMADAIFLTPKETQCHGKYLAKKTKQNKTGVLCSLKQLVLTARRAS